MVRPGQPPGKLRPVDEREEDGKKAGADRDPQEERSQGPSAL